jgi:hypothetical protein
MIQHDQQSRWKAWMRTLAVDIRPISTSMLRKSPSLSIGVAKPSVLRRDATVGGAPDLRLALIAPTDRSRQ